MTQGERRAAASILTTLVNPFSACPSAANSASHCVIKHFLKLNAKKHSLPEEEARNVLAIVTQLQGVGLIENFKILDPNLKFDLNTFLNRLLGMDLLQQETVLNQLIDSYNKLLVQVKMNNMFEPKMKGTYHNFFILFCITFHF